jgi:biofilm PGA synthesis N-glycosyltransferase PgaC
MAGVWGAFLDWLAVTWSGFVGYLTGDAWRRIGTEFDTVVTAYTDPHALAQFWLTLWSQPPITLLVLFLCVHPMGSAIWTLAGAWWFRRGSSRWFRPNAVTAAQAADIYPEVSVVIAAHNEELVIGKAIRRVLSMRWPKIDLIIVDDGSTDKTAEVVRPYVEKGYARLLRKPRNEGKSMALNDGMLLARGQLVLILDADGQPANDALELMASHLLRPKVAAVTGNPRVGNTRTQLARLQGIEFSATVGLQRRGDATWGRLTTVSGLCVLVRRDVVLRLGGFAHDMAAEDIEMTWKLQLAGFEVIYEPNALFGMEVPEKWKAWFKQRRRWALGLAQVLRRHAGDAVRLENWRIWPLMVSASLSILWVHLIALTLLLYVFRIFDLMSVESPEVRAVLPLLAATTIVVGVFQAVLGCLLDAKDDRPVLRQLWWAPWYPVYYWVASSICVLWESLHGLLVRQKGLATWVTPPREADLADERDAVG